MLTRYSFLRIFSVAIFLFAVANCSDKTGPESCLYNLDACPEGTYCDFMTQRCISEKTGKVERCEAPSDCPDSSRPLCQAGYCVACTSVSPITEADAECKDIGVMENSPTLAACVRDGMRKGQCGECRKASADQKDKGVTCIDPLRPVCEGGACRTCRLHSECEVTGVCNDGSGLVEMTGMSSTPVGACVPKEMITYVDAAHCSMSGADGTLDRPYCEIDVALRAIAGRGGFVVVRPRANPGDLYAPFTASDGKRTIIVGTGRDGAPLLRGATASGANTNLLLVDVAIESGSGSATLSCTTGARLSLIRGSVDARSQTTSAIDATGCDRIEIAESQLSRSRGPAVRVGTATRSYRIVNTLIVGSASLGPSAVTIATGATGSFAWNTMINNGPMGTDGGAVSCEAPSMPILSDSLIVQNSRSNRTDPRGNPIGTQFAGGCKLQRVVVGVDGAIFTAGPGAAIPAIPDLDTKLRLMDTPNNDSCCVDKGGTCDDVKQDYFGNERPQGMHCDLGAHELR